MNIKNLLSALTIVLVVIATLYIAFLYIKPKDFSARGTFVTNKEVGVKEVDKWIYI